MITLNQTVSSNDNDVIWVFQILGDSQTFRLATTSITLSSNLYSGNVIWGGRDGIEPIRESIGVGSGGGMGQVSAFNLLITRHSDYTGVENFFNSFYPATSGVRIISREVRIGFVWAGATTESQITWLQRYYVEDFSYSPTQITLYCVEYRELEMQDLPYYVVQKDLDNDISYFPKAPPESLGIPIPIVYGDFTGNTSASDLRVGINWKRLPTILIDQREQTFVVSSHELHTSAYNNIIAGEWALYKYLNGFDTYMLIYKTDETSGVNSISGHSINMAGSLTYPVKGQLYVRLKVAGSINDVSDITNATDDDRTTSTALPGSAGGVNRIALKTSGTESDSAVGILGRAASDLQIIFEAASDTGDARGATVNYWNPTDEVAGTGDTVSVTGTSVADYVWEFGNTKTRDINGVTGVSVPYTLDEICTVEYVFTNTETTVGNEINVYNAFLYMANINVLQQKWVQKKVVIKLQGFGGN
jgi:hypothetical protein